MKKLCLSMLTVATIASASLTFANNTISSGYYSTLHPQKTLNASAMMFPPTDITITNASNNYIYAVVPNSPINDAVAPSTNDHIRHNTMYGDTYISLQDPYHNQFWAGNVCRLGIVTIYGGPGSYQVNVDRELCN